jgi:hypothetical protein
VRQRSGRRSRREAERESRQERGRPYHRTGHYRRARQGATQTSRRAVRRLCAARATSRQRWVPGRFRGLSGGRATAGASVRPSRAAGCCEPCPKVPGAPPRCLAGPFRHGTRACSLGGCQGSGHPQRRRQKPCSEAPRGNTNRTSSPAGLMINSLRPGPTSP